MEKFCGLLVCCLVFSACTKNSPSTTSTSPTTSNKDQVINPSGTKLSIQSSAMQEGQPMDSKFTCDGDDVSPSLTWSSLPQGTQSLSLIMDDPDAPSGIFTHWVLYGMKPTLTQLSQGIAKEAAVNEIGKQGQNDFGKVGYNGPCPPSGNPHHYRFTLYALSAELNLNAGISRGDLEKAMQGKILAQSTLTNTYQRKK